MARSTSTSNLFSFSRPQGDQQCTVTAQLSLRSWFIPLINGFQLPQLLILIEWRHSTTVSCTRWGNTKKLSKRIPAIYRPSIARPSLPLSHLALNSRFRKMPAAKTDIPTWKRPAPTQENLDYAELARIDLSKWPDKKEELVEDLRFAVNEVGFW